MSRSLRQYGLFGILAALVAVPLEAERELHDPNTRIHFEQVARDSGNSACPYCFQACSAARFDGECSRVVGRGLTVQDVDANGRLLNYETYVRNGIIRPYAKLTSTFDSFAATAEFRGIDADGPLPHTRGNRSQE
jgi:hypothetical protein